MKKAVICIVGPTASGKTAVAVALAKRMQTEIVSADSVQVYRQLDIGSAKPDARERQGIVHHMVDCVEIDTPDFSVSRYASMAFSALDGILQRGMLPLVVGGSGLYVSSIVDPLGFAVPSDPQIRAELAESYRREPNGCYEALKRIDPITAQRLHPNDAKRIVRALEVYRCSGKPLSEYGNDFRNADHREPPYSSLQIGLYVEREALYERINRRVDRMMEAGLAEEARAIYDRGYDRRLPAMQSIGYRQLFACFDGECTLSEAVEWIKRETRRYAKRQYTWFLRDKRIRWIALDGNTQEGICDEAFCWIEEYRRGIEL